MNQRPRVETVEEFKLRIAAIIRAKPEQIPAGPRTRLSVRRERRATYRKPKRRVNR